MKVLLIVVVTIFFSSCFRQWEPPFIDDNLDESFADETPDEDNYIETIDEIGEPFSDSFKVIEAESDNNISFANSIGNIFYTTGETTYELQTPSSSLVKTDKDGVVIWETPLSFVSPAYGFIISAHSFSKKTGAIYLAGFGRFNNIDLQLFLIKIDHTGKEEWIQFYDTGEKATVADIAVDSEENIYLAGWINRAENITTASCTGTICVDSFVGKWNQNGERVWAKQSQEKMANMITAIVIDKDDNLYLAGTENLQSRSHSSENQLLVQKWNAEGEVLWKTLDEDIYGIHSVTLDIISDGIIVLAGVGLTKDSSATHPALRRYHPDGTIKWKKTWYESNSSGMGGRSETLRVTNSHIYLISSTYHYNLTILTEEGTITHYQTIASSFQNYPHTITPQENSSIILTGVSDKYSDGGEIFRHAFLSLTPPETD